MHIDHFSGLSGYRNTTWTLLYIADDGTSPQSIVCTGHANAEAAARSADEAHEWLKDFYLVAAIEGEPRVLLADDARSGERGLHGSAA